MLYLHLTLIHNTNGNHDFRLVFRTMCLFGSFLFKQIIVRGRWCKPRGAYFNKINNLCLQHQRNTYIICFRFVSSTTDLGPGGNGKRTTCMTIATAVFIWILAFICGIPALVGSNVKVKIVFNVVLFPFLDYYYTHNIHYINTL